MRRNCAYGAEEDPSDEVCTRRGRLAKALLEALLGRVRQ
jgi:hypothetical protein